MSTPDELAVLCQQALDPTNPAASAAAMARLEEVIKKPQSFSLLFTLLQQSPNHHIRQFVALLMRKKISRQYPKLTQQEATNLKSALLQMLYTPTNHTLVQRAIADMVTTLAKAIVPRNQWPELLPSVVHAVTDPNQDQRLGMYLLASVTESLGDTLREHYPTLQSILARALRPSATVDEEVCLHAMRATGAVITWLSSKEEIELFRPLIPMIVDLVQYFVQNHSNDEAIEAISILEDILESPVSIMSKFLPNIVRLMLEISKRGEVDMFVRQSALYFVQTLLGAKHQIFVKHKLVIPTLEAAFSMCAEGEGNDEAQQELFEEEETRNPYVIGAQLIDTLAFVIPVKHILEPAISYIVQYSRPENNFRQRRAAVTALSNLADGCAEPIKDHLGEILPYVVRPLTDASYLVRQAACIAMGQFADNLQPEIIQHHPIVLPALLQGTTDPVDSVVSRCCYALEAFCENMGQNIIGYLAPFMERMGEVLKRGNSDTQEMAVSAIASASVAAGTHFAPYFQSVFALMRSIMMHTGLGDAEPEKKLILRARATECVGLAALAVGEPAKVVVHEAMTLAMLGLELDFAELNEFTFGFFSNIAELLKLDFVNYLPVVMPHIFKSCKSEEGIIPANQQEEEEEENEDLDFSVRTSFLEEKSAACQAIGIFALQVKGGFIPWVNQAVAHLNPLLHYFHENVRRAALVSIQQITCSIHAAFPPPAPFVKGDISVPMSTQSKEYSSGALQEFISALSDKDPDMVKCALDSIGEMAQLLGPGAVNEFIESIIKQFLLILWQKAPCQKRSYGQEYDDSDEDEDEDEDEGDEEEDDDSRFLSLLDTVSECMVDLSHTLGALFVPVMSAVYPPLLKYARNTAHHSLRAAALGGMAECVKAASVLPSPELASQLLQLAMDGMGDQTQDIQRTSSFMCGVLLELGAGNEEQVAFALQRLRPLFDSPVPVVKDNACGAVARIVVSFPQSPNVPLVHILPILLPALPLQEDHQEDEPVWRCVLTVSRMGQVISDGKMVATLAATMVRGLEQVPPLEPRIANELAATLGGWFPQLKILASTTPELIPLLQAIANKIGIQ